MVERNGAISHIVVFFVGMVVVLVYIVVVVAEPHPIRFRYVVNVISQDNYHDHLG